MIKAVFHGEAILKKVSGVIPSMAKKVSGINGAFIICPSETSGNHHVVLEQDGVDVYEVDGVMYIRNEVEATVKCVDEKRHDAITLEPGIWKVDRANEYDFLKEEIRKVAD